MPLLKACASPPRRSLSSSVDGMRVSAPPPPPLSEPPMGAPRSRFQFTQSGTRRRTKRPCDGMGWKQRKQKDCLWTNNKHEVRHRNLIVRTGWNSGWSSMCCEWNLRRSRNLGTRFSLISSDHSTTRSPFMSYFKTFSLAHHVLVPLVQYFF